MLFVKPIEFTCQHCGNNFSTSDYTHSREGQEGPWWNRALCPGCKNYTIQKEKKNE